MYKFTPPKIFLGEVVYRVHNQNIYPQQGMHDPMSAVNSLNRGSPDGASYRAESPSGLYTNQQQARLMSNSQSHYERVVPQICPTGNANYINVQQPTTEPPAYTNTHNMYYERSGHNSCAGSDNSSSTGGTVW